MQTDTGIHLVSSGNGEYHTLGFGFNCTVVNADDLQLQDCSITLDTNGCLAINLTCEGICV